MSQNDQKPAMVNIVSLRIEALKLSVQMAVSGIISKDQVGEQTDEFLRYMMYGNKEPQNENADQS